MRSLVLFDTCGIQTQKLWVNNHTWLESFKMFFYIYTSVESTLSGSAIWAVFFLLLEFIQKSWKKWMNGIRRVDMMLSFGSMMQWIMTCYTTEKKQESELTFSRYVNWNGTTCTSKITIQFPFIFLSDIYGNVTNRMPSFFLKLIVMLEKELHLTSGSVKSPWNYLALFWENQLWSLLKEAKWKTRYPTISCCFGSMKTRYQY